MKKRGKRQFWQPVVALAVIALIIVTGCAPPAEVPEQPVGILRISGFPIAQTDPAFISSDSEVLIANHVYDYLVDIDEDNQVAPRLAQDWSQSDDGLTYEFELVEGAAFHDGTPLTAEDVVFTFRRLRDTEGLPTEDLYRNIASIEAPGEFTVRFTLSETNPFFLFDLSDNHALIIKDGTDDATDFNGTGPFRVIEYEPGDRIMMEANEDYFVQEQPHLDGLEIVFFDDQTAMADALRGGQIDLVMGLSTALFESLSQEPNLIAQDVPTNAFANVRMRIDEPPGDDPRVIEAMKLATDREEIFELVQQGYGAVGRDSPIGPLFSDYYTEEFPLPDRNPQRAQQLLAEAGYPDGLTMDLVLLDTLNHPDLAAVLQRQWADAGLDVTINIVPESIFFGEGEWLEVPLGIVGWGHRPYPQFYLDVMLACGARWNATRLCDEELDDLIATAGTTLDEQERIAAYQEIQRLLIERGPMLVPYFFGQFGVISDGFEGFQLNPFPGRTDLRQVRLAD